MNRNPSIRIGTQSAFSAETILAPFQYAAENGFGAFEWLPDKKESGAGWHEKDIDTKTRGYIKDTARKKNISLSVHAPWHLNPTDPDVKGPLTEAIGFAKDINASLLNIHLYTDQGIDAYVQGIIPVAAALAQSNIMLAVENTPLTSPEDFNALFRRLKGLAPDVNGRVGMCLDLGHANLCQATQNDYLRFIDLLEKEVPIIHVHLHENYGDYDSHLPVFTGPSKKNDKGIQGFVKRMKKRAFTGSIILEQWPDPPSLLNQAYDRLCHMFGNGVPPPAQTRRMVTDGFAGEVVRANRQNKSWRQRLSWIRTILQELGSEIERDQLAYLAIYLRFLGTGEVPCEEDGRHFRPSHHAKIAQEIFDCLAKATTPENALVVRRIYPWLPSFGRTFTRAEPLTRIRDIAHRNDIPEELKKEIKHTLQNKLHRCAGPEDLATSAALLERITKSDKGYPPDFIKAFKVFHQQLREFFNARSLDEQLQAMTREAMAINTTTVELIQRFLKVKKKKVTFKGLAETFELSTDLRSRFHDMLAKATGSQAQGLRTSEMTLEDFSFSLLSQWVNQVPNRKEKHFWSTAIRILELAVRNLELSQFQVSECQAMASELTAWRQQFALENQRHLVRLKASLDRCRRLAQAYCDKVLAVFIEKARLLGEALGVSEDAINVFCEADIRSHLVFQLSRALDVLLITLRRMGGISFWDVIVTGRVFGWLQDGFDPDALPGSGKSPIVLLLNKVEEDEVIPDAVVGVIATQAIPHLSHLAIRLRHRRLPCAVCEDKDHFSQLKNLTGKRVLLEVSERQVTLKTAANTKKNDTKDRFEGVQKIDDIPPIRLSSMPSMLPLDAIDLSTGGGKAFRAKGLKAMSAKRGSDFQAPQGVIVPFGIMEAALRAKPSLEKWYLSEIGRLKDLQEPGLSAALERLRQIIENLKVPEDIASGVTRELSTNGPVVVRSSANSEDLEGSTAAGVYDSVVNVPVSEVAGAIRQVWASLWSKRAFMARQRQGIPHEQSHMAVLIQPMLAPEYAFVMHTVNPMNNHAKEIYIELAVGMGQTLASGDIPGSPYRIICNRHPRVVRVLSYASFSQSLIPSLSEGLVKETIDYGTIPLSADEDFMDSLARRLASIGERVEDAMGGPQDIEGVIQSDKVYLVQTRPQLALDK